MSKWVDGLAIDRSGKLGGLAGLERDSGVLSWGLGVGRKNVLERGKEGQRHKGMTKCGFRRLAVLWSISSLVAQMVKTEGMVTNSSILGWRIPMDRGAWRATVHGVAKSRTRLND